MGGYGKARGVDGGWGKGKVRVGLAWVGWAGRDGAGRQGAAARAGRGEAKPSKGRVE